MTALPHDESGVRRCQTCLSAPDSLARNGERGALSRKSPPRLLGHGGHGGQDYAYRVVHLVVELWVLVIKGGPAISKM